MIIIGITGGIGSGKTYIAQKILEIFVNKKISICNADFLVHSILEKKHIFSEIKSIFPTSIENEIVNRKKLGDIVFADQSKLLKLENIIYPELTKDLQLYFAEKKKEDFDFVLFDVPLLFEKDLHKFCDYTIAVSTNQSIRKERVLSRHGYDEQKFIAVTKHQISDEKRNKLADFVIFNNGDEEELKKQIILKIKYRIIND